MAPCLAVAGTSSASSPAAVAAGATRSTGTTATTGATSLATAESITEPSGNQVACGAVAGDEKSWVSCMLDQMPLAQRVSQMFMIDVYGTSVDDSTPANVAANEALYGAGVATPADVIDTYHPGGIIYFTWSNGLTDPSTIVGLSNGLQQAALSQTVPSPLLISTDQEEGWIVRIGSPATVFPGNMAVGATGSTGDANSNAALTGLELRAMGVNVDNAPVVDTNINPLNTSDGIRSYGDDPATVSKMAVAAVQGFQGPGDVGAVAKHFPGLGDTSTNPDTGVTVSNQTLDQLRKENFPPFRAAIKAGVDDVMVTHIVDKKVDPSGVPSSLSHIFVTDLLRKELGFKRVIVTDAMNAQALAAYTPAQAAVMAVQAGDDELLYAQQPGSTPGSDFVQGYDAVLAAVQQGTISEARIDQSDRRLLSLKWRLGLASRPLTDPTAVSRDVGTAAHLGVARQTAEDSITVVKNGAHLLPLKLAHGSKILVTGYGSSGLPVVGNDIASRGYTVRVLPTGSCPSTAQVAQAAAAARQSKLVVVDTWNVWDSTSSSSCPSGNTPQADLVKVLHASGPPVIAVSVGTPYDIAYFPGVRTYVATYDPQPISLNAMVAVIFGDVPAEGTLPVTITQPPPATTVLFPRGWGIRY